MSRPLRAYIDLAALRHNYTLACECEPESHAIAVVKANAYGHGAVTCAKALENHAPAFAVACIEEALELRQAGIKQPIVLLEGFFSADELPVIANNNFWTAVHSHWQMDAILESSLEAPLHVWLKLDSGMHRLGFSEDEVIAHWKTLSSMPGIEGLHLITHFATADNQDTTRFYQQLKLVESVKHRLAAEGYEVPCCLANSPATLNEFAKGEWHRPGIMLYGSDPLETSNGTSQSLQPVMTLESKIIAIRDVPEDEPVGYGGRFVASHPTRIAVVACGYGDGYDRHAVDGTPVLVDGERAHVAGRVSMDMLTIDISHLPNAEVGSVVTLWGVSPQGKCLDVNEVADYCGTIGYTLLTGIMRRVPRIYR